MHSRIFVYTQEKDFVLDEDNNYLIEDIIQAGVDRSLIDYGTERETISAMEDDLAWLLGKDSATIEDFNHINIGKYLQKTLADLQKRFDDLLAKNSLLCELNSTDYCNLLSCIEDKYGFYFVEIVEGGLYHNGLTSSVEFNAALFEGEPVKEYKGELKLLTTIDYHF